MRPNAFSSFWIECGPLGTNVFLVLAGFFAWRSQILTPTSTVDYLKRRANRIFPLYWKVLNVYLVLGLIFPERLGLPQHAIDRCWSLLQNAFLVAPLFGNKPILDASWTLTLLLLFYLACPWLVRLINLSNGSLRIPLLSLLISAAFAQPWLSQRLALVVAGSIIFEASRTRLSSLVGIGSGLLAASSLLLGGPTRWMAPAIFICWLAIEAPPAWLAHRSLRWIGSRGFAFYLAHGLPVLAFSLFVAPHLALWQALACQPLVFAASLAFAALVHQWAESGKKPKSATLIQLAKPTSTRLHRQEPAPQLMCAPRAST